MSNEFKKKKIELNQDQNLEIEIISKAFNITPEVFLDYVIIREIDYIKGLLENLNPKEELENYYEFEINMDELRKLILVKAVPRMPEKTKIEIEPDQDNKKPSFFYLIETKEYPKEIIKLLKERNIPFEINKVKELETDYNDSDPNITIK